MSGASALFSFSYNLNISGCKNFVGLLFSVKTLNLQQMRKIFTILIGLSLLLPYPLLAQQRPGMGRNAGMSEIFSKLEPGKGVVMGKVIDIDGKGIEYTTITLYNAADSSIVDGTFTDTAGRFVLINIPPGEYFLEAKFIGFHKKIITGIKVTNKDRFVRIGKIVLKEKAEQLEEVVVTAQARDIEYKVDKKVINVSQNITTSSGTAVDVLQNVPSVEVDIQGNVTLRGSSNFTVFINGKPSALDGSEALQQIPASEIEKIEIITNPSAKYDPDGVAGIINIVTKRPQEKGYNGNITVTYDNYNSLRANAIFNFRVKKFNFFVGFNKNQRVRPADEISTRIITYDSLKTYFNTTGESDFRRGGWSAKTGFSYYPDDKNTITFTGKVGQRIFTMWSESYIDQVARLNDTFDLYQYYYLQTGYSDAKGWMYQADIDFLHKFDDNGHQLRAYAYVSDWRPLRINGTLVDTTDAQWQPVSDLQYGQESRENRTGFKARLQVDYERPLGKGRKFEAGYSGRYIEMTSDYKFYLKDTLNNWVEVTDRANYLILRRNIQAAYMTYTGKAGNIFDYQLGLRAEYVDRLVEQRATNEKYPLQRLDFFPTLHLSHRFANNLQLQFGYSRRVNRPSGWYLNPFPLYINQYTIMKGNPDLLPEFANSLELNMMKSFKGGYVAVETFYRKTKNKFQRIQTVADQNTLVWTYLNAGEDYSTGAEFSLNFSLMKMLMVNASTSVYYYQINGTLDEEYVNNSSFTWNSRLMVMAMLPSQTKLQATAFYRAPSVTLQGYRKGFLMSSFAVRQDFFKRKLGVTFTLTDPFGLMRFGTITDTPELYAETDYIMKSPQLALTLSLRINDYKPQRQQRGGDDVSEFEGEGLY